MTIDHAELIDRVRTAMQEIPNPQDAGLSLISDDRVRIDEYISAAIPSAVSLCQQYAHGVNIADLTSTAKYVSTDKGRYSYGTIVIPASSGFVSLYQIKLTEWDRAVVDETAEDSDLARCQYNPYTQRCKDKPLAVVRRGCRDTNQTEVVKIDCFPDGGAADDVIESLVIERAYDPAIGLSAVSERFAQAVVFYAASLTYSEMRMTDLAQTMMQSAMLVIGVKPQKQEQ